MAGVVLQMTKFVNRYSCCVAKRHLPRSYSSALFIPGNKANEVFALLSPYLDFDERFAELDKLRKNLNLRNSKIDAMELAKTWEFYKYIYSNKTSVEEKRAEIAFRMKKISKKKTLSPEEEQEKIRLTTQGKLLKQDLRILKETLWEMEETVIVQGLKLPNELHEKTPSDSPIVMKSVGSIREPPVELRKNHIEIGESHSLLEYKNPIHCYLCNEAAMFELGVLSFVAETLANDNVLRIAGTDFSRSLVVEASGLDHEDPMEAFILMNNEGIDKETCNRLHLVGGASLVMFLSMHTKQLINPTHFPLRYFATGRQYNPFVEGTIPNGLFTVCQQSVAQVFLAVKDPRSNEYEHQFDNLIETTTKIYDSLNVHYRVVMRSASELRPWESLRISYEMWSSNSRRYIEVGHISMCGRYLSKRLLIAYQTPTGRGFPAIISGTLISVPKLLGCLLEENPQKFTIPSKIADHMPGVEYSASLHSNSSVNLRP